MKLCPENFFGKVTFVTGPEKHCGKTTFMNRLAQVLREYNLCNAKACSDECSQIALLTVGYDGEQRDFLSGARKPAVIVEKGDVVVTTLSLASPCSPEILDVFSGSTSLGKLCFAKATRNASLALVGPEGNSIVSLSISNILESNKAKTVIVDGAINRITQIASIPRASFVYVLRVDVPSLSKSISKIKHIDKMVKLNLLPQAINSSVLKDYYFIDDVLSSSTIGKIPSDYKKIVVEDFTKIFLSDAELNIFCRDREIFVKKQIQFSGFAVSCRGMTNTEFIEALSDNEIAKKIIFNPYEQSLEASCE